jgi:hypothetical protein
VQKTTSVLLGVLVIVATALVVWRGGPRPEPSIVIPPLPVASARAVAVKDAGAGALEVLEDPTFGGLSAASPGEVLLDGGKPEKLPEGTAATTRFGVVLVQYRGAERASLQARSKADALRLAKQLAELARTDFEAAAAKGDPGSTANAGWLSQGVLEPAPEYVLFTTPKGETSGPVDTPTGYWIIRNLGK